MSDLIYNNISYDEILSYINNIIIKNKIISNSIILSENEKIDFNIFKKQKLFLKNISNNFNFDKITGLIIFNNLVKIDNINTILNINNTDELVMKVDSLNNIIYFMNDNKLETIINIENKPVHIAYLISYILENQDKPKKYLFSLDNNSVTLFEDINNKKEIISTIEIKQLTSKNKFKEMFQNNDFYEILGKTAIYLLNFLKKNINEVNIEEMLINAEPKIQHQILKKFNWNTYKKKLISVDEWLKYNSKYKIYLDDNENIKNILTKFVENVNNYKIIEKDNNNNNKIYCRKKMNGGADFLVKIYDLDSDKNIFNQYRNILNEYLKLLNEYYIFLKSVNKKFEVNLVKKIINLIETINNSHIELNDIFQNISDFFEISTKNIKKENTQFNEIINYNNILKVITENNNNNEKKYIQVKTPYGKIPMIVETKIVDENKEKYIDI